jgi:hypothetical protein
MCDVKCVTKRSVNCTALTKRLNPATLSEHSFILFKKTANLVYNNASGMQYCCSFTSRFMNFLTLYGAQTDSVVFSRHPNYLSIEFVRMYKKIFYSVYCSLECIFHTENPTCLGMDGKGDLYLRVHNREMFYVKVSQTFRLRREITPKLLSARQR